MINDPIVRVKSNMGLSHAGYLFARRALCLAVSHFLVLLFIVIFIAFLCRL
jgi:hypothetical protein